jgi:hypothetical protein
VKRVLLSHSAIVKSPGLLPILYIVRELSEAIGVADRTLRDWLFAGAPHFYHKKGYIWIDGREFADWVAGLRKPKRDRKLKDHEAYCMRCNQVVDMVNPTVKVIKGNLLVHKGKCPNCHCTINRGGRRPNPFINKLDQREFVE